MKNYNNVLQEKINAYISETGISQSKLAGMIGISQTALSQWRNSKYDNGNIEEIESKILEFFKLSDDEKEHSKLPKITDDYIPISTSETVYGIIRYCHLEKNIGLVYGDSGVGKTRGAKKYIDENPTNSIYIIATPITGTLSNIMASLAAELKVPVSTNKMKLLMAIREKLKTSNKIIIIDEAQFLKYSAIEELRLLREQEEGKLGIVFIGNEIIYDRMIGKREAEFAQQFSRIIHREPVRTDNISMADIELIFSSLDKKECKKELDLLYRVSRTKHGIRGAVNTYNKAVNNTNISYKGLLASAISIGVGIMS